MVPGLFRSLPKGERKDSKLDITYKHGKDSIRFWRPEALAADDLRVLQGLIALRENYAQLGGRPKLFSQVWGKSPESNRQTQNGSFNFIEGPLKASSSGNARIFIPIETKGKFFEKALDHHPESLKLFEYHKGGGAHKSGAYYKFEYRNGRTVKVIDPESGFEPGTITKNQVYLDTLGRPIEYIKGKWRLKKQYE